MSQHLSCPRRHCGAILEGLTDGHGRVVFGCPACARNWRGLCRDCPSPIERPRRLRCQACARRQRRDTNRRYDARRWADRRPQLLARLRVQRMEPAQRERRRRWAAEYRAAHPRDAFDRLYGRERQRRLRQDPMFRTAENARKRVWRARRTLERAA